MDENLQEDWLDVRLREEASYIDDAGFTARVVQRLPAPSQRRLLRAVILICLTLLGSILTYIASSGGKFIGTGIDRVVALPVLWILTLALACSIVLTSLATAAAVARIRNERFG
jgi:hypothetical protein